MNKKYEIEKRDIKELKLLLKDLVKLIKYWKVKLKLNKRKFNEGLNYVHSSLKSAQIRYRNFHIAYCELMGTPRHKIEGKNKTSFRHHELSIERIKEMYYVPQRGSIQTTLIEKLF